MTGLWVDLNMEDPLIEILNVYAPTDLQMRVAFWRSIVDTLQEMDSWIIGGDFNNLETQENQQGWGLCGRSSSSPHRGLR